jgi:hypothetical protein
MPQSFKEFLEEVLGVKIPEDSEGGCECGTTAHLKPTLKEDAEAWVLHSRLDSGAEVRCTFGKATKSVDGNPHSFTAEVIYYVKPSQHHMEFEITENTDLEALSMEIHKALRRLRSCLNGVLEYVNPRCANHPS